MSKHPLYNQAGLQKNNQSHVLYALVDKQLELQQLKDEYSKKLIKLQNDLTALEATICLFDENCSETIEKIKQKATDCKKKVRLFKNGELTSLVLQFLKESSAPLSTKELADLHSRFCTINMDSCIFYNIFSSYFIYCITVFTFCNKSFCSNSTD